MNSHTFGTLQTVTHLGTASQTYVGTTSGGVSPAVWTAATLWPGGTTSMSQLTAWPLDTLPTPTEDQPAYKELLEEAKLKASWLMGTKATLTERDQFLIGLAAMVMELKAAKGGAQ